MSQPCICMRMSTSFHPPICSKRVWTDFGPVNILHSGRRAGLTFSQFPLPYLSLNHNFYFSTMKSEQPENIRLSKLDLCVLWMAGLKSESIQRQELTHLSYLAPPDVCQSHSAGGHPLMCFGITQSVSLHACRQMHQTGLVKCWVFVRCTWCSCRFCSTSLDGNN